MESGLRPQPGRGPFSPEHRLKTCLNHARQLCLRLLMLVLLTGIMTPALAMEDGILTALAGRDFAAKSQAVSQLIEAVATGDAQARELVLSLATNDVPNVRLNNILRQRIGAAASVLALESPDRAARAQAVQALVSSPPPAVLVPIVEAAIAREQDAHLQERLALLTALMGLQAADAGQRREAVQRVAETGDPQYRTRLLDLLERNPDGSWVEPDESVRQATTEGIASLDAADRRARQVGTVFAGISLGSVLLLAALGLAITYGLIGVINMAHGEFLMIGAYATFVVQNLFRQYAPEAFDWYPLAAVPAAFLAAALVGVVLERLVLRHLYGRPLETLLTTFGVSLLLMQSIRMLFGAQNVEVMNPSWMSGGLTLMPGLLLPWNRLAIILFALIVVATAWLVLNHTRLGLFVRAVTQNRGMAACAGVPTHRVDTQAFAFGAGIAGLGGCALSQIGNVGPDLGQAYIIDSFMVVVLGGVGQLAGTIVGAFGLGILSKTIEPFWGAVLAKIAVLLLIILFIQKRPQGLFALKGRSVEA